MNIYQDCLNVPRFLFTTKYDSINIMQKFIYSYLLEKCGEKAYTQCSIREMSDFFNLTNMTIIKAMKKLSKSGLIRVEHVGGNRPNIIHFLKGK